MELALSFTEDFVYISRPLGCIRIDRKNASGDFIAPCAEIAPVNPRTVFGILGIIRIFAGPYLVAVKNHEHVGNFRNASIHRVLAVDIIPLQPISLSASEVKLEEKYLGMYRSLFDQGTFYYAVPLKQKDAEAAPVWDLTNSLQRNLANAQSAKTGDWWDAYDRRFFWNRRMMEEFRRNELRSWVTPLIRGYFETRTYTFNEKLFSLTIISRLSIHRAGCRFTRRGCDMQGNAANSVETEQILTLGDQSFSFVQTRGSVPLIWAQQANLKYKPKIQLYDPDNNETAMRAHFNTQVGIYGDVYLISLLDQKGFEKELENKFGEYVERVAHPRVKFLPFDFHTTCKGMKYENLSKLVAQVEADIAQHGFCEVDGARVVREQRGVFRTNCLDSLDRTGVVQSVLAKHVLLAQMRQVGLRDASQLFDRAFTLIFNAMWANNADTCSRMYTGTPALKTDYTRTGKRTKLGALRDGLSSARRYILNNFMEGERQDAIDLFLGNYAIPLGKPSPYAAPANTLANFALMAFLFLLTASAVLFRVAHPIAATRGVSRCLLKLLYWAFGLALLVLHAKSKGRKFANKARFIQPDGPLVSPRAPAKGGKKQEHAHASPAPVVTQKH